MNKANPMYNLGGHEQAIAALEKALEIKLDDD